MSNYDAWLEAPYQRRAAWEEAVERVEEDLWNGGGALVDSDLSEAIQLVASAMPDRHTSERFANLVGLMAEAIVEDGGR